MKEGEEPVAGSSRRDGSLEVEPPKPAPEAAARSLLLSPNSYARRFVNPSSWHFCGVFVALIAAFMRLSGVFLLSTTADLQAREDILEPYRDRFRMSLVSNWSYYIAVNLYNNEDIMPQFSDQIMMLAQFLGPSNVYFSAFENGSTDKTREALRSLELRLATAGVGYNIAMGEGDWRSFCNDISEESVKLQCNTAVCTSLRRCPVPVRIAVMAAIRNKALEPLLDAAHAGGKVPRPVDAVAHGPGRPASHAAGRAAGMSKRVSGGDAAGAEPAHRAALPDHGRGGGPAAGAAGRHAAGDAAGDGGDERSWEEAAEAMLLEEEQAQAQGDRAGRSPAGESAFPVSDAVSASKALGRLLAELGAGGPAPVAAPAPAAVGSPRHTWTGQGHGSADAADAEHEAGGEDQELATASTHHRSGGGGSGERRSISPVHHQNYAAEVRVASSRAGATGSNPFGAGTLTAGPGGLWGISSRRAAAPHLGLYNPVMVVFLNDVLLYAEDVVELLLTEDGHYDMACGMDFEQLKLYDTWVARDMSGATFSDWYPYLREGTAQALMRQNKPFRVFSCWNGGVVVPAAYILRDRILFRTWRPSEVRSLHPNANKNEVFNTERCTASECMLFCKDMWEAKHRRIYMNPRVRFTYNHQSEMFQRVLMRTLNALVFSWSNRASATHHSLRSSSIRAAVGSTVPWTERSFDDLSYNSLPLRLSCGLSEDDAYIP